MIKTTELKKTLATQMDKADEGKVIRFSRTKGREYVLLSADNYESLLDSIAKQSRDYEAQVDYTRDIAMVNSKLMEFKTMVSDTPIIGKIYNNLWLKKIKE